MSMCTNSSTRPLHHTRLQNIPCAPYFVHSPQLATDHLDAYRSAYYSVYLFLSRSNIIALLSIICGGTTLSPSCSVIMPALSIVSLCPVILIFLFLFLHDYLHFLFFSVHLGNVLNQNVRCIKIII